MCVTVSVKWGKEKFSDVECNTEEPPEVFKAQLFALSGVQPDRQKVMMKGAVLKVSLSNDRYLWLCVKILCIFIQYFLLHINCLSGNICIYSDFYFQDDGWGNLKLKDVSNYLRFYKIKIFFLFLFSMMTPIFCLFNL